MISTEVWVDIHSLHRRGKSIRRIARELGLARKTVRRYLRRMKDTEEGGADGPPRYVRRKTKPAILAPYTDYVRTRLEQLPELPATVLLREIRAQGYPGQITMLKDLIRPLRAERRRLQALTVRYETAPGEQMQVDWGEFHRLPDGRKLYGLAVVLSWSRMQHVHFTCRMTVQELLVGLIAAFTYFGGWAKKLLFDNPKTVVLVRGPTVAASKLHPRFLDFLGHHGLTLQLCEPARPRTKGKVERPMDYLAHSLVLPNRDRWTSPEEANRDGRVWLDAVANARVHGTTRERPVDRWLREGLVPLTAARPYDTSWREARRVHHDCHFAWEGNRYSVPWQHGGTAVLVRREAGGVLEVERDGQVIARHRERVPGRGELVTLPEHVAGLWAKTLGRKRTYAAPGAVPAGTAVDPADCPAPAALLPGLPILEVEPRALSIYQQLLDEPMLEEVGA
jgi:transposase